MRAPPVCFLNCFLNGAPLSSFLLFVQRHAQQQFKAWFGLRKIERGEYAKQTTLQIVRWS